MRYLLPNKLTEGADPKSITGWALNTATLRSGKGVKVGNDIPLTWIPKVNWLVTKTGGLVKQYRPGFCAIMLRDLVVVDGRAPAITNVKTQSSMGIEPGGAAARSSIPVIVILTGSLGRSMDKVTLIPVAPLEGLIPDPVVLEIPAESASRIHMVRNWLLAKVTLCAADAVRLVVGEDATMATAKVPVFT